MHGLLFPRVAQPHEPNSADTWSADTVTEQKLTVVIGSTRISHGRPQVPCALQASEPAAGFVIDLRSFTSEQGLPARLSINMGVRTTVARRPSSLIVICPGLPADAERRGSSEEAMRNAYSECESVRVDNQVAGDAAPDLEGLPNRLLTALEVAAFVGCHEETVQPCVLARTAEIAAVRRQTPAFSSTRRAGVDPARRSNTTDVINEGVEQMEDDP